MGAPCTDDIRRLAKAGSDEDLNRNAGAKMRTEYYAPFTGERGWATGWGGRRHGS